MSVLPSIADMLPLRLLLTLFVVACTSLASAAGQTITDGDTLKLSGTTYRLWGIGASILHGPETA
jgi:hypothetical protein